MWPPSNKDTFTEGNGLEGFHCNTACMVIVFYSSSYFSDDLLQVPIIIPVVENPSCLQAT